MRKVLLAIGVFLIIAAVLTGCSKAEKLNSAGEKSFLSGDYVKAADCYLAAVSANPNRADYYINYGMTLIELGKYEEALSLFDKAYMDKDMLVVRENNKRALRGKGIAYYYMKLYDKSAAVFKTALNIDELSDLDMDILYYMADSLKKEGSYGKAAKAYTSILKLDGKEAAAYAERAFCYRCMGVYDKSLADYDSAIKLAPEQYDYYFGKYYLMEDKEDIAGATAVLLQAEALQSDTEEGKYNLAKVHFYQGDYDNALTELNQCYTKYKEAGYYIGEIYRIKKDYTKAVYYYKNTIDGGVKSPDIYNQTAVCLIKTGEFEEALKYLEMGIEQNNSFTDKILKRNEIIVYENLGRFEEAKQKLKDYLEDYPKETDAIREAEFIDTRIN